MKEYPETMHISNLEADELVISYKGVRVRIKVKKRVNHDVEVSGLEQTLSGDEKERPLVTSNEAKGKLKDMDLKRDSSRGYLLSQLNKYAPWLESNDIKRIEDAILDYITPKKQTQFYGANPIDALQEQQRKEFIERWKARFRDNS